MLLINCSAKEKSDSTANNHFVKVAKAKEIKALSTNKQKNSIVYLWADWCPPCKKFGPIYKNAAKKLKEKNIVFYKVDVDEDKNYFQTITQEYEIEGIPTLLFFNSDGALLKKIVGYRPYDALIKIIKKTFKE